MNPDLLFLPALAQILLTLFVYIRLAAAKSKAAKAGEVNEERRALHDDAWPDRVIQINNNIRNQFELPILFYLLCFILWALAASNIVIHVFAWIFVASRMVHVAIHTGSNDVPTRRKVFMFGFLVVAALAISALILLLQKTLT